jgi:hypothetical protein
VNCCPGLPLNLDKCQFFKDSVTFCGHIIDRDELHKTPDKIQAITNAPKPENITQLKSFLGLVIYYGKPTLYHSSGDVLDHLCL